MAGPCRPRSLAHMVVGIGAGTRRRLAQGKVVDRLVGMVEGKVVDIEAHRRRRLAQDKVVEEVVGMVEVVVDTGLDSKL